MKEKKQLETNQNERQRQIERLINSAKTLRLLIFYLNFLANIISSNSLT
jgi:hypothetical protein